MKFHEVGVTNKDAQFLELRKFQITDIARLFRVPPHMIADLDRATFSNIEQQSLEFVMHTMTPWAERWEASIESELLFDGDDLEVEFDFANLMRGDAASRSTYYQSGIQNGWLTRNEARIAENLNPLQGLDEPLRPLNMVEEGAAERLINDADPVAQSKEPAPAAQPNPADEDANARIRSLVHANASRLARRLSRSGPMSDKDLALIAEALALPLSRVRQWSRATHDMALQEPELTQSLITLGTFYEKPTAAGPIPGDPVGPDA